MRIVKASIEGLLEDVCPGMTGAEQRRSFAALVGFQPDVVLFTWRKYTQELRLNRVTIMDIAWACSFLRIHSSHVVMARLWKTTRETFRRLTEHAIKCLSRILNEVRMTLHA